MTDVLEKTLYDGRLHFHKRINDLWIEYHKGILNKNYEYAIDCIDGILTEISGLVNEDIFTHYNNEIMIIQRQIAMMGQSQKVGSGISNFEIKRKISILAKTIRKDTKRLYIPFNEFETEINIEKIMRESD